MYAMSLTRVLYTFSTACLLFASGVSAENATVSNGAITKNVPVYFGDLSLSAEAGANELLVRITAAASVACGGKPSISGPLEFGTMIRRNYEACMSVAVRSAVETVGHPMLTTAYLGRNRVQRESVARR
jgi:UrcA family protein